MAEEVSIMTTTDEQAAIEMRHLHDALIASQDWYGHDDRSCVICTEPAASQVHRDIDPAAIRGPWDIPHHEYAP